MNVLNGFIGSDVDVYTEQEIDGLISEIGSLDRANPARKAAVKKITKKVSSRGGVVATRNLSAKAEFESRLYLLPQEIVNGLKARTLQIVDMALYTNKLVDTASSGELMLNSDVAVAGLTNINARKLEPNHYFLLTGITLLSAVNADPKAGAYAIAPAVIKNGDFRLTVGQQILVPRTSCAIFDTASRTDVPVGYYKLENPKLITPQTEIKPEFWASGANASNTCIRVVLHGAMIMKY